MFLSKYKKILLASVAMSGFMFPKHASAITLNEALEQAYSNNTELNIQRAKARASEENIDIAKSAFFPQISVSGGINPRWSRNHSNEKQGMPLIYTQIDSQVFSGGVTLSQNLFNGMQSYNDLAQVKSQVKSDHENLRNAEQAQLINAVAAYMNVYTSRKIVQLRRQDLASLEEQVRAEKVRLRVGAGTRTNLAQAEAARAQAISNLAQAEATLKSSEATYRQVIGVEPEILDEPKLAFGLPTTLEEAYDIAQKEHPAILSSKYQMDAGAYSVKSKVGALLPSVDVVASSAYTKSYTGPTDALNYGWTNNISLNLSLPIFTGGRNSASVRQAKELYAVSRIAEDQSEEAVRQSLESSWAQFTGLRSAISAARNSIRAAKIALDGRIQENRVGQATTLDVLDSRSKLISAQITLANSEKNLILASYNIKAAIGRMTAKNLGLKTQIYDVKNSYEKERKKNSGLKNADGR